MTREGISPTYYVPFKDHVALDWKHDKIFEWLDMPLEVRPQLITGRDSEPLTVIRNILNASPALAQPTSLASTRLDIGSDHLLQKSMCVSCFVAQAL